MKFHPFIFIIIILFSGCKSSKEPVTSSIQFIPKKKLTSKELETWYQKDYVTDSILGISLNKWYALNKKKPNQEVIVAVIDTQLDINHEDLKGQFWTNQKEITNNNIDDDNNGYVDDIHGWNFTSNKKEDYVAWGNFESVRFIRQWDSEFKGKTEDQIKSEDLANYKEYQRALKVNEKENIYYNRWFSSLNHSVEIFPLVKDTLKHFFPKEDYTYKQLDSLYKIHKLNDKTYRQRRESDDRDLGALIFYMMINIQDKESTLEALKNSQAELDSIVNRNLNKNFNDRKLIGDNPNVLEKGYGNGNISISKKGFKNLQGHGTKVVGIIGANRKNNIGIKGFSDNIKIMPLNISYSGDENDKDIAMAIYYAVDNGAKVINMSFGKEFSVHQQWVSDAFKYAEKHNVLLVHASGNEKSDNDKTPYYPSDNNYDGTPEICNNFINVGSISKRLDNTFVSAFSNYGKQNVDLFAPGEEIYTTTKNNTYGTDSGTSLAAPMVSGTAALIWTYYPKLSAIEVKQIIMDSGTAYNLEVIVPGTKEKKIPFSELSKSGKVLNVYNAMQLAEKFSKKKK
ncbi:S8 family peptidase [Flavobacterium sp. LHD-85]|uniref:S8 family peptidase n=1 Tax=Flavobacterium sp. LHD-85 TaxID=3071410 RepID=UPI0027E1794B|nr:S8 family peptidase [Flavobacterium sp. LHD-85]MDQ6527693.1 S8 family peptidase [Flavobacterium sp. LHD-85]